MLMADLLIFFKNGPVSNPALSDLYVQEWNAKVKISSKGKQYMLFIDNLNIELCLNQCLYYSKIIMYRA